MADNVYNLKFTLSNGDVIDAGQITAPQGPKGDKGDSADIPYSSSTPFMDGVGSVGSANTVARGDHRHPSDTSRQEKLVSGTNIKTINGQSVLGSGDIPISGGSEYANTSEIVDNAITLTSTSTLADLAKQILAQKTKVVRALFDDNLKRILGTLSNVMPSNQNVLFKVVSTPTSTGVDGLIECYLNAWSNGPYYEWKQLLISYSSGTFDWAKSGWVPQFEKAFYPVGSVYISTTSSLSPPPVYYFGGTWEQIKDVFLLAAGDTYTAGSTGGSADAVVVLHDHIEYGTNTDGLDDYRMAYKSETGTDYGLYYNPDGATTGSKGVFVRTADAGVDGTGKNMPPYLAVYMWKRIA